MTVTSGFFNSIITDGIDDRPYDAFAFDNIFEGLLEDGVLQSVGFGLSVKESVGMEVIVQSGRAWFDQLWLDNDADVPYALGVAHATLPRIDTIVLDFNKQLAVRAVTVVVLQGVPGSNPQLPSLISDSEHTQYPLADIRVNAQVSGVSQVNITNRIGTDDTPFATGILASLSIEVLLGQWEAEFQQWFIAIQDSIGENAAGNLQLQIDALPSAHRNILINGDMGIVQRQMSESAWAGAQPIQGYFVGPDRWRINIPAHSDGSDFVGFEVGGKRHLGIDRYFLLSQTATDPAPPDERMLFLEQRIERSRLVDILKGTPDANMMSLSFLVNSTRVGTYIVELRDVVNNRHVSLQYVVAQSAVDELVTILIPADSIGELISSDPVDDIDHGLTVRFWLDAGADFSQGVSSGVWGPIVDSNSAVDQVHFGEINDEFMLAEVQLEVGIYPSEYERLSRVESLQLCQRYYENDNRQGMLVKNGYNDFWVMSSGPYIVPKRDTPVVSGVTVHIMVDEPTDTWSGRNAFYGLPNSQFGTDNGFTARIQPGQGDPDDFVYLGRMYYEADSEL